MYTGVPSLFIRTSGCNLRCVWCDTPYTSWKADGQARSIDEIMVETDPFRGLPFAVVTGGEPMLQRDLPDLIEALKARGHHITIETAGTIFDPAVRPDFFSISPKTSNSTPGQKHPYERTLHESNNRHEPLSQLVECGIDFQLKFVVQCEEDMSEIVALVESLSVPHSRVYLMPQAVDKSTLRTRGRWLAEVCKREGFSYSGRLHIDLWGNTRGT